MNKQKDFSSVAIAVLVIVLFGGAGYLLFKNSAVAPEDLSNTEQVESVSTTTVTVKPPAPKPAPTPVEKGQSSEVQKLLETEAWVSVTVMLKGNEFTASGFEDDVKRESEVLKIQNSVLVTLNQNDFILGGKFRVTTAFSGKVSKSGLSKLISNPTVTSIDPTFSIPLD